MSINAFLLPGQGCQYVGMGKRLFSNFPAAVSIADMASDILHKDVKKIMLSDPDRELNISSLSQPIIITFGYIMSVIFKEYRSVNYFLGHSLGEITALVCAGVIELSDALNFAKQRGSAMDRAIGIGEVAIAMDIGEPELNEIISDIAKDFYIGISAYNSNKQFLVAGEKNAILMLEGKMIRRGTLIPYKLLPMKINAPFHSKLMQDINKDIDFNLPVHCSEKKVVSSITGELYDNDISVLKKQLVSPVRWNKAIEKLINLGVQAFIDLGPQRIVADLLRDYNFESAVTVFAADVEKDFNILLTENR